MNCPLHCEEQHFYLSEPIQLTNWNRTHIKATSFSVWSVYWKICFMFFFIIPAGSPRWTALELGKQEGLVRWKKGLHKKAGTWALLLPLKFPFIHCIQRGKKAIANRMTSKAAELHSNFIDELLCRYGGSQTWPWVIAHSPQNALLPRRLSSGRDVCASCRVERFFSL